MEHIPKIPEQYREEAEKIVIKICDIADKFWPIISELGNSVIMESENCNVIIYKKGLNVKIEDGIS